MERRDKMGKALHIRGLRQRWMVNSVAPVCVLLILVVILVAAGVSEYYYGSMRRGLEQRAQATADAFGRYFSGSYTEYYQQASNYADTFEEKESIELQFLTTGGKILVSASNLTTGLSPGTGDISDAVRLEKPASFQGKDPQTQENILSVSCPIVTEGRVVGVLRMVTALQKADRQILLSVLVVAGVAGLCMALILITNLIFINNVVEPVDLQAEFEDAIFTYRELFRQEGIELRYDAGEEVLPAISGDPERLKQVFCNVLDNAAKHGGAGKRIDAALTEEDGAQVIRIRDYGPGIPEGDLPYVKQKFYKGASKARGSGIGLAVCDEIIKLHDGTFTIENAYGGGCLVTIRLPEQGE